MTRHIVYTALDSLQSATTNPKRHDLGRLGASVERFGYVEPVVVDERTGRLVAGHGRVEHLRAAREAGESPPDGVQSDGDDWLVPVVRGWGSTSDAEADAYLVASNRLVELGGWDGVELNRLTAGMDAALRSVTGFTDAELKALLPVRWNRNPDDTPDDAPPITKPGDLWTLGAHRLLCADSTDPAAVSRLMAGERSYLCATDPPFLVDYDRPDSRGAGSVRGQSKATPGYVEHAANSDLYDKFLLAACAEALHDTAVVYQWFAEPRRKLVADAWTANGIAWHQTLAWVKPAGVVGYKHFLGRYEPAFYGWRKGTFKGNGQGGDQTRRPPHNATTVWEVGVERDGNHPTQKPVDLFRRPIEWHTRAGEIVYEPFGGSGTQIIAAEMLGRRCFALELAPAYADVICRRFEEFTGTPPLRESDGAEVTFLG